MKHLKLKIVGACRNATGCATGCAIALLVGNTALTFVVVVA